MRAVLALAAVLLAIACARTAGVLILDVRVSRETDNRVIADVQLEAVEQGGGHNGPYCVSIHWVPFGFDGTTPDRIKYDGELDAVEQCSNDLRDGDQRTFRLVSNKTDLPKGLPARAQVRYGDQFQTRGAIFAP
jgi:hypothetical protein